MATLHLICGLPCAGKTTLAKQLELAHAALRLTPDEWDLRLFGADFDEMGMDDRHDDRHNAVEALMWELAARVLSLDVNVILDFGVWAREERDDFRARAAQLGAGFQLHFRVYPKQCCWLVCANLETPLCHPAHSPSPKQSSRSGFSLFQRPTPDELAVK